MQVEVSSSGLIRYLGKSQKTNGTGAPRPAVFCDRDGTLIYNRHYLKNPDEIEFIPGAIQELKQFSAAGYLLILVSNQSGIARGYFGMAELNAVHERLTAMLKEEGIEFDAAYYCPHGPEDGCACRKPASGMIDEACRDFMIDKDRSLVIGDSDADEGLAQSAGIAFRRIENNTWKQTDTK